MGFDLVVGDTGRSITITFTDVDGAPIDLTGKTPTLRYRIGTGAVQTKAMTPADQGTHTGQASYQFTANDLAAGTLEYEGVLDPGGAAQLTTLDTGKLTVRAAVGA